jgi:hypothetical protein
MEKTSEVYVNPVQLKVNLVNAKNTIVVGGRAIGKTTGIHGPRTTKNVIKMPYSSNGFISRSYKQFKTRIMGSLVSGWRDLGFEEWNEKTRTGHFLIGKKNPLWPSPKYAIGDYTQAIHWFTGSVVVLISQDRSGDANGSNLQSLSGDEAFQLDKEDLDENVIPALRGMPEYSDLVEYQSITLTTSMPLTPDGAWIFDFEKESDPAITQYIMQCYGKWYQYHEALNNEEVNLTAATKDEYKKRISSLERLLQELRCNYTYYLEADSFENFHVLGEKYFRKQRRILSDDKFNTQIANLRPQGIEISKRFYPQLAAKHFYIKYNNSYFDNFVFLPEDKDTCYGDLDCNRNQPLNMSIDFGGRINSMLIFQDDYANDNILALKEFFAEQPEYLNDLVNYFDTYYRPMQCRVINVYYDVNGKKHIAQSNNTDIEVVQRLLIELKWEVNLIEIDSNPMHDDKYEFINLLLAEQDRRIPRLRIHQENCPNLKIALFNTELKMVMGKKKKNKGSEKNGNKTPQRQATHITDTLDYFLFRRYRTNIEETINNIGITLFG